VFLAVKNLEVTAREEKQMTLLSWVILLTVSAVLATAAQYLFFRHNRKATDYDWVYIAGGALLGGFTAHVWYPVGPVVAGLYLLPALAGTVVLGAVVELIYRAFIRPRQNA
jgi:cytochrome c biogenesis protein CcdA